MPTKVLDSWALITFFDDGPGAEEVEKLLIMAEEGRLKLIISILSWGEIYSAIMQATSQKIAEQKMEEIAGMPIEIVPVREDLELVRQAAIFKATTPLTYARCFAAALTKVRNAELVTGDQAFRSVAGPIKVGWLQEKPLSNVVL